MTTTFFFETPELFVKTRLGMVDGIVSGENDQEGLIEAIPKRKAEDIVQVIRSGMHEAGYNQNRIQTSSHQISGHSSITDELSKLGKLVEQGIITDEEFAKLKKDLLERKSTR